MEIGAFGPTTFVTTVVPLDAKSSRTRSNTGLGATPISQSSW